MEEHGTEEFSGICISPIAQKVSSPSEHKIIKNLLMILTNTMYMRINHFMTYKTVFFVIVEKFFKKLYFYTNYFKLCQGIFTTPFGLF